MSARQTSQHKATARNKKAGLTLGDLRKLLECSEDLDDATEVRVTVGWKSQLTEMRVG